MYRIGIKDFKRNATRIFRGVREEGARYVITYHGRPTAVVLPLDANLPTDAPDEDVDAAVARSLSRSELRAELDALRTEIERTWTSDDSAVDLISDQRR